MDKAQMRPSKVWRAVLIVSLGLNLAVAGMIGGALVSGRFGDGPPMRVDLGLGAFARALDEADRRAIGRDLRQMGALRSDDLRAPMAEMVAALRADPFDPARLQAAMAAQAARLGSVQAQAQTAVLARVAAMQAAQRAALADRLDHELRHMSRGGGSGGRGG